MDIFIQLITAFFGALGFSLFFHVSKNKLFMASVGGLISWTCYIICSRLQLSDTISFFIASAVSTIYAEFMARKYKAPATVFIVPATIPMIPGGHLYQTFVYALQQDWKAFFQEGLVTLLLAVAISCGILFIMTIMKMFQKIKESNWNRRFI